MVVDIPQYGLKAYALFYSKYGTRSRFKQSELDWIVSTPMKKKIFSLLLRSGWIRKHEDRTYSCVSPESAMTGLLEFRVPEIMKAAEKPYAFTKMSSVEIWSDYSYVQRGIEKSPYFIRILEKDIRYWKAYFSKHEIPCYFESGQTIGEYVILLPVKRLSYEEKEGLRVDPLRSSLEYARSNEAFSYAVEYIQNKYGETA